MKKLTKRDAEKIASKLDAEVKPGRHMKALVSLDGQAVARFGIRHGASSHHGHLPQALSLSASETRDLARCQLSKQDYRTILMRAGKLKGVN